MRLKREPTWWHAVPGVPWVTVLFLLCVAAPHPADAMPTITTEPEKYVDEPEPLSTDPANPTVFTWGAAEPIVWWAESDIPDYGPPDSSWHVRNSAGQVSDYPAGWGWVVFFCYPEDTLPADDYEFWVTATDSDGTVFSQTYYIRMIFPPLLRTKYHTTATEFIGKLARLERTAFNFGGIPNGTLDSPEVNGCDNPSMFYGDGKLHFIFGDPNVYTGDPGNPQDSLSGALAFTDRIVPEKGIDISHRRNWATDPETGVAKSLIEPGALAYRTNNTGGAVLPHGDGQRIWFAYYDYGGGPRPGYLNYVRVGIAYSDDGFATPAVRDSALVLWDKDDLGNGPCNPHPYLGYFMRVFKDHLYMMVPREGAATVLLRCRLDELDRLSLADWHYLVSVDTSGQATWSEQGVTRGQISQEDFPTVDFGGYAGIIDTVVWNPYLNRWVAASDVGANLWESRWLWGPYQTLMAPQVFDVAEFLQAYAFFTHETMLGNNGEWIFHASARSWSPLGLYGTYNQKIHMRDMLRISLSAKSGVAGDRIAISCVNASELPAPVESLAVTVDGRPATFSGQDGDTYRYTYTLSGAENGGTVGAVDVAAVMRIPLNDETMYSIERDVALVVNHRNEVRCGVTSPRSGAAVAGRVALDVSAAYDAPPEDLGPGRPEVRILKTELRSLGSEEVVEDVDLEPPYTLHLDTTRYPNGPHTFKVVAYDMLDRRGVALLTLNVQNPPRRPAQGNLMADGNMEAAGTGSWQPLYGGILSKVSDGRQRGGTQSLRVLSLTPTSWAGFSQTVSGLRGGERLRFSAWSRLENNYTADLRWAVYDGSGRVLTSQYIDSYGDFRRVVQEIDNPAGSTQLRVECLIRDTGTEGVVAGQGVTTASAIVDDVVVQPLCYPAVVPPTGVVVQASPAGDANTVSWDPGSDPGPEYFDVYRKLKSQGNTEYEKVGSVHAWDHAFTDTGFPGSASDYDYKVVVVDSMGWTADSSAAAPPDLSVSMLHLDSTYCPNGVGIVATLENTGAGVAPALVDVAFYDGDPSSGGARLGVVATSGDLEPGGHVGVQLNVLPALTGAHTICAVADDHGQGSGSFDECDETNNKYCEGFMFCVGSPRAEAAGPYTSVCQAGSAQVHLDGTRSSDPGGGPITYGWLTTCPDASFDDPASATPVVSLGCAPPCPLACGVTLVVNDTTGGQDIDGATLSVGVGSIGEVSNVAAGAPPLRIASATGPRLIIEKVSDATAYNVYADAIGSWYSPTAGEGSVCGITTWTDNNDGTVTLDYVVPENSWIVVTASNPCHEGPAGPASDGSERTSSGTWALCGAAP